MKYEFHVGDYVETMEGKKGYLSRYQVFNDGHIVFYVQYKDEKIYPCDVREDGLRYRFVRIGQYNFTKSERLKKIKQLEMKEDNIWNERSGGWLYLYQNKINELVKAVNRLEEKVNEMA